MVGIMWKSTSSSDWEYFDLCEKTWVRVLCMLTFVLLFYYFNLWKHVLLWY